MPIQRNRRQKVSDIGENSSEVSSCYVPPSNFSTNTERRILRCTCTQYMTYPHLVPLFPYQQVRGNEGGVGVYAWKNQLQPESLPIPLSQSSAQLMLFAKGPNNLRDGLIYSYIHSQLHASSHASILAAWLIELYPGISRNVLMLRGSLTPAYKRKG